METTNESLKVLQILPELISGGVERGTIDLACYLKKHGHDAYVLSNGGKLVEELKASGVHHIKGSMHTKNVFKILYNAWKIAALIKRYKFDIVHARSRAPAWSAYLACKMTGTVFITTFHAAYSATHPLKRFYNSVMLLGDKVIAISNFIAKHIETRYRKLGSKISVVPRGVDIEYFDCDSVSDERVNALYEMYFKDKPKEKIILLPARFTAIKGHKFLLKALKYLKCKKYKCLIVGKLDNNHYDYYLDLENMIKDLGLEDKVIISPNASNDMPALYKISDIVLCTSQEPEGFGRVVVEAQAMKKIIIATDIGSPVELITENETGFLGPTHDPSSFAEVIDRALSLTLQDARRIGENAFTMVQSRYTLENMCSKTIALYKQALQEKAEILDDI